MSLSVGASGSALINQLLASLYPTDNNQPSTPSNSDANTANTSTAPGNSFEGTGKPSFSDDILSTFMQLQQSQENQNASNFLDPAKTRVDNTPSQPAPASQNVTSTLAHNNMMRAIRPDLASNATIATPSVPATIATVTDDTDDTTDTSDTGSVGFQTASRAAFGV